MPRFCARRGRLGLFARLAFALSVFAPLSLSAQTENAATRDYAVALGFEKKGHFPEAIERWKQFLTEHPKDNRIPLAHYHLGLCHYQNKGLREAATAFHLVLSQYKDFAHRDAAEFNLALVFYQQANATKKPEDFQKAAKAFLDMRNNHPKSAEAAQAGWYQAECLYQAGDKAKSIEAYQQTISSNGSSPILPELYLAMGTTQQEMEQFEPAEKTFQTFLNQFGKHPQMPEARLRLGMVKMSRGQLDEAERCFREAAQVKDFALADFAELERGQALFQKEKFAEAAKVFEELPRKFPKSEYLADAQLAAGKSRFREGKSPDAERSLRQLLDQHKESPLVAEASYWLGQTLRELKRSPEAVKVLDHAIALPTAGEFKPQLEFARLEALADDPKQAAESLSRFADFASRHGQHPLAADALYRAARAALELGDAASGRKHSAAFLARADAANHRLWGEVIFIAAECELLDAEPKYAAAEKFYRELIAKRPGHSQAAMARVRIGHCLEASGQHDHAIGWLSESLKHLKEKPLQAESHFLIGSAHAAKKQQKPAIEAFRQSRQIAPDWDRGDEAILALAMALETDGNPQAAIGELNQLLSRYPQSSLVPRGLIRLGDLRLAEKKWDEAAGHYRDLVAKFPKHDLAPLSQYRLGAAYFQKADYSAAEKALCELLTKWPTSQVTAEGRSLRGNCYFQLKQPQKAIDDLNAFLAANPQDAEQKAESRWTLALAHAELKQHQQTVSALESLLKDLPNSARADEAHYELAFAYQKLNEIDKAAQTFQTLATRFPLSPLASEAWFRVGEIHEGKANPDEALKAYQAGLAAAKEPKFQELLLYKLGQVNYDRKAYAEAAGHLKKLIEQFPQGTYRDDAVYLQAEALFDQSKFTESFPIYVQATRNPSAKYHARAHYRAGQCATEAKQWADAEKHFQIVVDQFDKFPQRTEARYGLAFAQQNQRKFDPARSQYLEIIKETETETAARARFMLGECDFAEQKFATAWEHYLEAALGYPYEEWKAQGHYQAGRCFLELKQPDKAREELENVIEQYPNHALVKDAQQLLKTIP